MDRGPGGQAGEEKTGERRDGGKNWKNITCWTAKEGEEERKREREGRFGEPGWKREATFSQ